MRLWMILPKRVYDELQRRGRLTADGRRIDRSPCVRNAYLWMAEQMRQRLGPPPRGVTFPLWAWARWDRSDRPSRPDLRSVSHMEGPGTFARIELEVPASRVLLSDFEAWHHVINGSYLSWSEAEDKEFHERCAQCPNKSHTAEIIESWNRIFDFDGGDPAWRGIPAKRSFQATLWYLRREDVAVLFTARLKTPHTRLAYVNMSVNVTPMISL